MCAPLWWFSMSSLSPDSWSCRSLVSAGGRFMKRRNWSKISCTSCVSIHPPHSVTIHHAHNDHLSMKVECFEWKAGYVNGKKHVFTSHWAGRCWWKEEWVGLAASDTVFISVHSPQLHSSTCRWEGKVDFCISELKAKCRGKFCDSGGLWVCTPLLQRRGVRRE